MNNMRKWVKLPSGWIEDCGLHSFKWLDGSGASETAALMVLMSVAHHADLDQGIARITYEDLAKAVGVSRTKISDGLDILKERNLIIREPDGRSTYQLNKYGEGNRWAALPAKPLYNQSGVITIFEDFYLRKVAELDALKIYLLFATRRDTKHNVARITYDQISDYSGINTKRIKRALGILNINGLITVESYERVDSLPGASHGYRLTHLFPSRHAGTTDRATRGSNDDLESYD